MSRNPQAQERESMTPRIIVSYDDTDNDRDALALGRLLAVSGAELSLAYVRHQLGDGRDREALEQKQAEDLLAHGAQAIGAPDTPRHVIVHASTGQGLIDLAAREHADVVVFGSEYRTAPGAVVPGTSAQRMLRGGSTAVAIAPADLRSHPSVRVARVGILSDGDDAAGDTAQTLAGALGAQIGDSEAGVDLLVIGSRDGTPDGRLELSAAAEYAIEMASCPVLAVPRSAPVLFAEPALSGA
jgi:nucleotide-binding universal stress UspA family protein